MALAHSLKFPDMPCGQFSGHETFPLRQLWLPKIAQAVDSARTLGFSPDFTSERGIERAILSLGIGKNMVSSARFWAKACGVITEGDELTEIGKLIFGQGYQSGKDPYCANPSTVWLVHWNLASTPEHFTPIWFLFNQVNQPTLDRQTFVDGMKELCRINGWKVSNKHCQHML